ncbi:MAG: chemotaxis protein CheW [Cyanophyceae cyanobacterium]
MTNQLVRAEPQLSEAAQRSLKLVFFQIGNLNVAFPIDVVQKIINRTTVYGSGLNHTGIAHVGDQEITVVDLHKRLFQTSQLEESGTTGYIVLFKNSHGEQMGILSVQTPTLMDVSLSELRVLPESYRRADTLEIASHVAVIPQVPESLTIFLLDSDRLI